MDKQPDPKKTALQELAGYLERKHQEIKASREDSRNGTFAGFEDMIARQRAGGK